MGQNGAGKSTLIKVLTGVYRPTPAPSCWTGGRSGRARPQDAQDLGISTVYQEVNLCPNLSVAENIFIGRYPRRFGHGRLARHAQAGRGPAGAPADRHRRRQAAGRYPLAIQQMVAIARALLRVGARADPRRTDLQPRRSRSAALFGVLRRLREQGMAILFVTHFLDQTYAISDRITVMRNGEREGEYACSDLSRLALVNKMIGARPARRSWRRPKSRRRGAVEAGFLFLAHADWARKGVLRRSTWNCAAANCSAWPACWAPAAPNGAPAVRRDKADSGSIEVGGKPHSFANPRDAIAQGIAFCSEDRKHEGAILPLSVRENLILALQARPASARDSR
jgi:monosaccharide-transporting ATPase